LENHCRQKTNAELWHAAIACRLLECDQLPSLPRQEVTPTLKAIRRFYLVVVIQSALLTMAPAALRAQDETPDGYVTRKEYEELKTQMLAMKKELDALKKEKGEVSKQESAESHAVADVQKQVAPKQQNAESQVTGDMHKEVIAEAAPSLAELEASLLGTTKFLLAGWAEAMYEQRNGQASTFS